MKKTIFPCISLILVILLSSFRAYGQPHLLTGTVMDEDRLPVEVFNVIVLHPADSTYVKGDAFFNGRFEMRHDLTGDYLVNISCLGYEDAYIPVRLKEQVSLDTVVLRKSSILLKDVVVTGTAPLVRQVQGKLVVQISNTPLASLGSVTDILGRAPGLKMNDGEPEVFGKGKPLIFIDGKEVKSFAEVEMLQPNEIVSIEIDRNPSSRYIASAASVLHIKTKRGASEGFSTQVFNTSYFARRFSNRTGVRINFSKGRFKNYLGYDFIDSKNRDYVESYEINHLEDDLLKNTTLSERNYSTLTHQFLFGSTYRINPKSDVSVQYNIRHSDSNEREKSIQTISQDTGDGRVLDISQTANSLRPIHILNATYRFKPDSLSEFTLSADYSRHDNSGFQTIREKTVSTGQSETKEIANKDGSNVYVLRSEYSTRLFGEINTLSGFRYGHIGTDNRTSFANLSDAADDYTDLTGISEYSYAAYFTLGHDFKKVGLEAGLRYEGVKYKAVLNDKVIRDKWDNHLFPSFSVSSRDWSEQFDLSLNYSSKISRPSMYELNPALSYYNSIAYSRGNPLLKSTITHSIALSATLWKNLNLSVEYEHEKNPRIEAIINDEENPGHMIFTPVNIDKATKWSVSSSYSNNWSFYTLSLDASAGFPSVSIPFLGETLKRSRPEWYFKIGNDFNITKTTVGSLSYYYSGKCIELMTDFSATSNLSVNLSQYAFKKKLQFTVSVNDIFRKSYGDWKDRYGSIESGQYKNGDSRHVRLTVRFNFNNYKNVYDRKSDSDKEIDRLR